MNIQQLHRHSKLYLYVSYKEKIAKRYGIQKLTRQNLSNRNYITTSIFRAQLVSNIDQLCIQATNWYTSILSLELVEFELYLVFRSIIIYGLNSCEQGINLYFFIRTARAQYQLKIMALKSKSCVNDSRLKARPIF